MLQVLATDSSAKNRTSQLPVMTSISEGIFVAVAVVGAVAVLVFVVVVAVVINVDAVVVITIAMVILAEWPLQAVMATA